MEAISWGLHPHSFNTCLSSLLQFPGWAFFPRLHCTTLFLYPRQCVGSSYSCDCNSSLSQPLAITLSPPCDATLYIHDQGGRDDSYCRGMVVCRQLCKLSKSSLSGCGCGWGAPHTCDYTNILYLNLHCLTLIYDPYSAPPYSICHTVHFLFSFHMLCCIMQSI